MTNDMESQSARPKIVKRQWDEICTDARTIEKIVALYRDGGCTLDTLMEMLTVSARRLNESINGQGSHDSFSTDR